MKISPAVDTRRTHRARQLLPVLGVVLTSLLMVGCASGSSPAEVGRAVAESFGNPCFGRRFDKPVTEAVACLRENGSPQAQLSSGHGDVDGDGEKEIIIRNVIVAHDGQEIEIYGGISAVDDSLRGGCFKSLPCHEAFPEAHFVT